MTMNRRATPNIHRARRGQLGLSLVELMISMAIGLILLLGITTLIVQQNSSRDELEKSSRQIENGRYAIQTLRDDIQHAGYYGELYAISAVGPAMPDPCDTTIPGLNAGFLLPLEGYDFAATAGPAASPITCLKSANLKAGTDILVVRRAATEVEDGQVNLTNPPEILLQTNNVTSVLDTPAAPFNVKNPPLPAPFTLKASDPIPAPIREYLVRIYFVSPCSVPAGGGTTCTCTQQPAPDRRCLGADDNGNPIPTLKRLDITGEGATNPPTPVPLAEGVESMQLDYGVDTDGDGYPEQYLADPSIAAPLPGGGGNVGGTPGWQNVVSVRINLLARNTTCTTGFQDTKTYNAGPVTGNIPRPTSSCPNGDYKRHLFVEQVRAINPSGKRAWE